MKRVLLMSMIVLQAAGLRVLAGDSAPSRAATERFHIAVLSASRKEGPVPDLPASEAKALADFRKVMTYKSFTVDAETLLQSDRSVDARLGAYRVMLSMEWQRNVGDSISVQAFQLMSMDAKPAPIIETSFSIKRGETIVLGASTTDQQAKVVLVTALP